MKLVDRLPKPRLFEAALQGGLRSSPIRVKIYRSFKYVRRKAISEEVGVASLVFLIGAPSKID